MVLVLVLVLMLLLPAAGVIVPLGVALREAPLLPLGSEGVDVGVALGVRDCEGGSAGHKA